MKRIEIYRLPETIEQAESWSRHIKSVPRHAIDCCNWCTEYPYTPQVSFAIGWNATGFFLDYQVCEQQLRAVNTDYNTPVWEDSCVECFFQFERGDRHYSFEFNPVGAVLGQINFVTHGDWMKPEDLSAIQVQGTFVKRPAQPLMLDEHTQWELSAYIPFTLLAHADAACIATGKEFFVNFFKCGDKCRAAHFLSWNPIVWPQPSFHRPQFFGCAVLK